MDEKKLFIKEFYEKLSPKMKEWINSSTLLDIFDKVATKHNLNNIQKELFKNEIFLVLLGIEPVSHFRANLVEEVRVSYDQALKIAFDINSQVFGPVMTFLKNMEQDIFSAEKETAVDTSPQEKIDLDSEKRTIAVFSDSKNTDTQPDHMLPSHDMMPGLHIHSQTLMPSEKSASTSTPTPTPTPKAAPTFTPTQPEKIDSGLSRFTSIVDQKLSKLVRTERGETTIKDDVEERRKEVYKGADPYREPTN